MTLFRRRLSQREWFGIVGSPPKKGHRG